MLPQSCAVCHWLRQCYVAHICSNVYCVLHGLMQRTVSLFCNMSLKGNWWRANLVTENNCQNMPISWRQKKLVIICVVTSPILNFWPSLKRGSSLKNEVCESSKQVYVVKPLYCRGWHKIHDGPKCGAMTGLGPSKRLKFGHRPSKNPERNCV
jgi:hypothetical protein